MKVLINGASGYKGLSKVKFPVEVEVERDSPFYEMLFVSFDELSKIEGFIHNTIDCDYGGDYCFYYTEVTFPDEKVLDKKSMHPEDVYSILRDEFIAKAEEYGVDITSNHCDEFLNDLYDQCYHCLSKNIPEDDL
ncbi:hypothetical protein [Klebsiella phage 05F01]|nr:hypothetical protein [Klebsiella phage 05F01]